ncbi:MAG: UPF0280 family protein [Deltaproteobacteria bacterium]|nr:UPF0280 family protein [Deltaproteobacteria bacterium]
MYQERTYRNQVHGDGMRASYRVVVKETDLFVRSEKDLANMTRDLVLRYRAYLEAYIRRHQGFLETLVPWIVRGPSPRIIRDMAHAGQCAGVGPMAAVAGAIAESVGRNLLDHSGDVIVENGGDLFIKSHLPVTIGVFANKSPLSLRIGLRVHAQDHPMAVCTSSGTVGHSLSMGKADAVCILSESCSLADAAATAVGNQIQKADDIQNAIDFGKNIKGVEGILAILHDKIGMWGNLEVVSLQEKKVEFIALK